MTAATETFAIEAAPSYTPFSQHAHGTVCYWHGPTRKAYFDSRTFTASCPICGGPVKLFDTESFWAEVRRVDKSLRNYEAMLRWSEGKCFLDFQTLEESYNQASTE